MSKQVLIDERLFGELVRFHCLEVQDDEELNQHIKQELETKLNKMCERLEYAKKFKDFP